jgi:hypothetical protein
MTEHGDDERHAQPPHVQLIQGATAYWESRLLYVAGKLKLADHLADTSLQGSEDDNTSVAVGVQGLVVSVRRF